MRKVVVISMISLDGVMQAPGGPEEDTSGGFKYGGWTWPYADEFSNKIFSEEFSGGYDLLLGRKTTTYGATIGPGKAARYPALLIRRQNTWFLAAHQS